jgi:hypothetical protein
LKELEAEERKLRAELETPAAAEVIALHPAALARYQAQLEELELQLASTTETMDSFRALVTRVTVHADYTIDIEGRLSELTGAPLYPTAKGGGALVAGEGVEPPTPGL